MHPLVNIAISAARAAGDHIVRQLDRAGHLDVETKGVNDFVTEVDRRAEQIIIDAIKRLHPDHAFIAEESGEHGDSDHVWIIDPLDGTTNFLHGVPQFAVSIACRVKGRLEHGVIYDPMRQELFVTSRGRGAMMNDRRIRVSQQRKLEGSLLGTGFPYCKTDRLDEYMEILRDMIKNTAGIRRPGSAALDLAWVAAGRIDGFWEFGLKPWDIAAGVLLVQEAGGLVSDLKGGHAYMETGDIVCGNPKIFKAMLQKIASY